MPTENEAFSYALLLILEDFAFLVLEILADDNNCLIFALNELNYNQVMEEISRKPVKAGLMWEKL